MEIDTTLIKVVLDFVNGNRFAALGLGIVFALYLLGRFGTDVPDTDWEFTDPDEAIAFYENRIAILKQVRDERQGSTDQEVLNTLLREVQDLHDLVDQLKQGQQTQSE